MVETVFNMAGAEVVHTDGYPGWAPNPNSPALKIVVDSYARLFSVQPVVRSIHAGLECGILGGNYPNWDMISFGPTIRFPHSPDEKVNIATVQKFWDFLVATLESIPEK